MNNIKLDLAVRYVGFGKSCSSCGQVRETTHYILHNPVSGDVLQDFRLCDKCQDKGHVIRFEIVTSADTNRARGARQVRISRELERGLARDVEGKVQPGSGNQDDKDDVRVFGEWRFEHKYTDNCKDYKLQASDLLAVVRHAKLSGEWPAFVLNFRKLGRKFVTIPYELFLELMERLRAKR